MAATERMTDVPLFYSILRVYCLSLKCLRAVLLTPFYGLCYPINPPSTFLVSTSPACWRRVVSPLYSPSTEKNIWGRHGQSLPRRWRWDIEQWSTTASMESWNSPIIHSNTSSLSPFATTSICSLHVVRSRRGRYDLFILPRTHHMRLSISDDPCAMTLLYHRNEAYLAS